MLAITNIFRGTAESVAEYLTFVVNSLAHALLPALMGLAVAVLAALFHGYTSRNIEKVDALNGALIQRVREYLRTQPRATGVDGTASSRGRCHRDASLWEPIGTARYGLAVVAVLRSIRPYNFVHGIVSTDGLTWSLYEYLAVDGNVPKATILVMAVMPLCAFYNMLLHLARRRIAAIAANSALKLLLDREPVSDTIAALKKAITSFFPIARRV